MRWLGAAKQPATDLTNFTPGDLVVLRGGDSANSNGLSQPDGSGEVPVYLDEYTTSGTYVGTVAVPNMTLPGQGVSSHEGGLNLTTNGQYLTFGGYDPVQNPPGAMPRRDRWDRKRRGHGDWQRRLVSFRPLRRFKEPALLRRIPRKPGSISARSTAWTAQPASMCSTNTSAMLTKAMLARARITPGLFYVTPGASPSSATVQTLQPGTDWRNVFIGNNTLYGGTGSSSVGNHDPYLIGSVRHVADPIERHCHAIHHEPDSHRSRRFTNRTDLRGVCFEPGTA